MKRIIALILCLVTVLSFAACGQKAEPATTTNPEITTQATTEEATMGETVAEVTQPEETVADAIQPEETKPGTEGKEPTTPAAPKKTVKQQFDDLTGVVGLPLFDAVAKLGCKESDIKEVESSCFSVPIKLSLGGTKYKVFFGVSEDSGKVHEVLFRAEFSFKPLDVAQVALKTVDALDQWVGKEKQLEADGSFQLRDVTDAEISAGLSMDEFACSILSWDYSKKAQKQQKEYIKECEKTDYWQDEGLKGILGVSMEVSRACERAEDDKVISDICMIVFSVGVMPKPAA